MILSGKSKHFIVPSLPCTVQVLIFLISSSRWARSMVADDEARYPIDGRSTVHTTREELDLALGMDANFDDWDIVNPSEAIDGNGMQADQLDGDVEIGQLGDLAQTATVTV